MKNSKLPTFAQLAAYQLNKKKPNEKNIIIKIEALTAQMMIDNEEKQNITFGSDNHVN